MKRWTYPMLVLLTATTLVLAGCGGGGGGGSDAGEANPSFTTSSLTKADNASTFSAAVAINDGDLAVGLSDDAAATIKAVAWTISGFGAATTSVPTILALPAGAGSYSAAYGINAGGAIVGEMESAPAGAIVAAFWASQAGAGQALPLLAPATQSAAYGISAGSQIVGELIDGGTSSAAFWATPAATPSTLPVPLGTSASVAYFINDNGEIVGEVTDGGGIHAALWVPNAAGDYVSAPVLLPSVNGDSLALTINTAGNIVGEAAGGDGEMHAVRWVRSGAGAYTMADLGPSDVGSSAAGINDAGRIVGYVNDSAGSVSTASAWRATPPTTPFTIDALLAFSQTYAINNVGRAVGFADGQAFVAAPK